MCVEELFDKTNCNCWYKKKNKRDIHPIKRSATVQFAVLPLFVTLLKKNVLSPINLYCYRLHLWSLQHI